MVALAAENVDTTQDFQFSVTLYGGRLATIKVPVPLSKRNLERLKNAIEYQLEPLIGDDEPAD